jgi:hypothetical protein
MEVQARCGHVDGLGELPRRQSTGSRLHQVTVNRQANWVPHGRKHSGGLREVHAISFGKGKKGHQKGHQKGPVTFRLLLKYYRGFVTEAQLTGTPDGNQPQKKAISVAHQP